METNDEETRLVEEIRMRVQTLQRMGRNDLLLRAIGVPTLEELRIEAARGNLSPLHITSDYRFFLTLYNNKEVELPPLHKAVYLLFLHHPEGIEFKRLVDYRGELFHWYKETSKWMSLEKMEEGVNRIVDPLDNAIHEKCSRIKKAFSDLMDEYSASYYIISSHTKRHVAGSTRVWYERLKVITLPRELVIFDYIP
ncbi:MAG: hypothetical protein IKW98_11090 [Prevotella sp.]|nr:hypothetical protein [Prevotella sp.]